MKLMVASPNAAIHNLMVGAQRGGGLQPKKQKQKTIPILEKYGGTWLFGLFWFVFWFLIFHNF